MMLLAKLRAKIRFAGLSNSVSISMIKYLVLFFLLFLQPVSVTATELSCTDPSFKWSKTRPAINLRHIFCGEIDYRGRAKGFHSKQLLASATHIARIKNKKMLRGGIYNGRVKFANGKSKFSTFFPDHCTIGMIVRSTLFAARNKTKDHYQWGILGASAPAKNTAGYCLAHDGRPFTIRMGLSRNQRSIVTAFPQP